MSSTATMIHDAVEALSVTLLLYDGNPLVKDENIFFVFILNNM